MNAARVNESNAAGAFALAGVTFSAQYFKKAIKT